MSVPWIVLAGICWKFQLSIYLKHWWVFSFIYLCIWYPFLRSLEQFIQTLKGRKFFVYRMLFQLVPGGFSDTYNKIEHLEFKLEKNWRFRNMQEKLEKSTIHSSPRYILQKNHAYNTRAKNLLCRFEIEPICHISIFSLFSCLPVIYWLPSWNMIYE